MSSDDIAIAVSDLEKVYRLHRTPHEKMMCLLSGARLFPGEVRKVLDGVSFELHRGESLGIIGVNGSGKSTLLQIIAGTLQPTAGAVRVNGKIAAILELGAGFNPELSGRENVSILSRLYGVGRGDITAVEQKIIEFSEIGAYLEQPVKHYSSGMFVRLAFSVIIHVQADILVVDEALAVGDAFFAQKCLRHLEQFRKRGTLIFVSHDMAAIRSVCSRVIWLEDGVIRAIGDPRVVGDSYLESRHKSNEMPTPLVMEKIPSKIIKGTSAIYRVDGPKIRDIGGESHFVLTQGFQDQRAFGDGGAKIVDVSLRAADGSKIKVFHPGVDLTIRIEAKIISTIDSPIFGFFIRNRMGLNIFGDNSFEYFAEESLIAKQGERWYAEFEFEMPLLPKGEYSISVALASGTNTVHTQMHWVHDALFFNSFDRQVHADILSLPLRSIRIGSQEE